MKLFAASALAFLLPMGEMKAQSIRVGLGIRIGLPSVRVVIPRRSPRVHVRHHRVTPTVRVVRSAPRGHWVLQQYRHWVPAAYAYRRDVCGRRIRYLVRNGYYEIREKKVWVPAPRQDHRTQHHRTQHHRTQQQRAQPHPQQGRRTRVGVLYS